MLLIESKVQARLSDDQLARHERTLRRRGFEQVRCLALTKDDIATSKWVIALRWSALYEWLGANGARGQWAERLRSYLRAAEVRLAREGYLTEGTLTMFDGFPFSAENPYTYGEGKRLLKLAMGELRANRELLALGIDPKAPGRGAITGRGGIGVWDFLSLVDRPKRGTFTDYPHMTLSVTAHQLGVAITIPNGVVRSVRNRLIDLGADGFARVNAKILRQARPVLARGGWVEAEATQRHYPSQRSPAVTDAKVVFNLATSQSRRTGAVKPQFEWVELFAQLLRSKRSNIQFSYIMQLPWGTTGLDSRQSLALIADGWCTMKPLLDAIRGIETG